MPISKTIRFEVFKRDNFKCSYCGKQPPDVVLEVDHIYPKSKGGKDEVENLATACFECNRGKRNRELDALPRKENLDVMKEKYEQLKEFYNYQKKIAALRDGVVEEIGIYWSSLFDGEYALNERGKGSIKRFLSYFSAEEIKDAMSLARNRLRYPEEVFKYTCGVLHNRRRERDNDAIDEMLSGK